MSSLDYLEILRLAAPEAILVLTGLVVLMADAMVMRGLPVQARRVTSALITATGCGLSFGWIAAFDPVGSIGPGVWATTEIGNLARQLILALAFFTALLGATDRSINGHAAEFFAVVLFATVGLLLLVGAEHLLMIFLAIELASLSLYVLAAFNKQSRASAEAGIKYFLFGGISAAFMLYGFSLVYGVTGAMDLPGISRALEGRPPSFLLTTALLMVMVGFAFKIAAAPYHLWAPDVYQGSPLTSAALIASGSKVASFYVLARVLAVGFGSSAGQVGLDNYAPGWLPLVLAFSVASMILGNLAALVQVSVRRLLAYSAIAHAGYLLIGVMSGMAGLGPLLYYTFTYGLATLGAFGVVSLVQNQAGNDRLEDFAGLAQRSPVTGLCMLVFLLSLAGIPPLAGFFAKFHLFAVALQPGSPASGLLWLVGIAIALSAVSLYYYLQVLKQVYVREPQDNLDSSMDVWEVLPLVALALAVLGLGCAPDLLLEPLARALR